jgi:hypothetical protein
MNARARLQQIQGGKDSLLDEIRRRANEMADMGVQSTYGYGDDIALQEKMNAERAAVEAEQARQALRAEYEALARQYEGYNQNLRNEERRLYNTPRPVQKADPRDEMFFRALAAGAPIDEDALQEMTEGSNFRATQPRRSTAEALREGAINAPAYLAALPALPYDLGEFVVDQLRGTRSPNRMTQMASVVKEAMGGDRIPQAYERSSSEGIREGLAEAMGEAVNPLSLLAGLPRRVQRVAERAYPMMRDAAHTLRAPPEPNHIQYPREVVRKRSLPPELLNDRTWPPEMTPRMLDEFEGVRVPGWGPKAKYDIPGPEPLGPVDGLYYHQGLDNDLRGAAKAADSLMDPSYYDNLMSALSESMRVDLPPKARPQYKLLSPYGNMVDELPVSFRNGGSV